MVYNKINQTDEQNKQNEIIAQEKINMDIEIKEMEKQIQNLKAAQENTKSLTLQEQIENLKSELTPKAIIDTREITPTNTISVITNTQSKLIDRFNRNNIMKQLYEGFNGGMKKKYTRKHRLDKYKRNTKRKTKNK